MRWFLYAVCAIVALVALIFLVWFVREPVRAALSPAQPKEIPQDILSAFENSDEQAMSVTLKFCSRPFDAHYELVTGYGFVGSTISYSLSGKELRMERWDDILEIDTLEYFLRLVSGDLIQDRCAVLMQVRHEDNLPHS